MLSESHPVSDGPLLSFNHLTTAPFLEEAFHYGLNSGLHYINLNPFLETPLISIEKLTYICKLSRAFHPFCTIVVDSVQHNEVHVLTGAFPIPVKVPNAFSVLFLSTTPLLNLIGAILSVLCNWYNSII